MSFRTWIRVLRNSDVDSLRQEIENTDLKVSIIWMAGAGIIGTILGMLILFLYQVIKFIIVGDSGSQISDLFNAYTQLLQVRIPGEFELSLGIVFLFVLFSPIVIAPLGLLFISGILYSLAKMRGGEGEFDTQTYLISTFAAPLNFISLVFRSVPYLGITIVVIIGVFQVFLANRALQAAHNFAASQSLRVILIPLIFVGIFLIFGFGIMALWWF